MALNLENLDAGQGVLYTFLLGITLLIQVFSKTVTSLEVLLPLYLISLSGFLFQVLFSFETIRATPGMKLFSFLMNAVLISVFIHFTAGFSPFILLFHILNILLSGIVLNTRGALLVSLTTVFCYVLSLFWAKDFTSSQLVLMVLLNCTTFFVVGGISGYLNEVLFETKEELIEVRSEKERLEWDLKQKEKLAAIGQLAAGIAHEIRNPLASISGSVELLSQQAQTEDDQKLMKIILKEISRLNGLISEFLDYAKPEKPPEEKMSLDQVLEESLQSVLLSKDLLATLKSELKLNKQIQPVIIKGYKGPMKQALLNFLINAVQSMKDQQNPELIIQLTTDENLASLTLIDNGCGMSEETATRIFEPFFTTKAKGTGLGLAMTHKILTLHSAQVSVESKVGFGSRFMIQFPLAS